MIIMILLLLLLLLLLQKVNVRMEKLVSKEAFRSSKNGVCVKAAHDGRKVGICGQTGRYGRLIVTPFKLSRMKRRSDNQDDKGHVLFSNGKLSEEISLMKLYLVRLYIY